MRRKLLILCLITGTISLSGQCCITTTQVNLRLTPELGNNKIMVIPRGATLKVLNMQMKYKGWLPVVYNGKAGFVWDVYILKSMDKPLNRNKGQGIYSKSHGSPGNTLSVY